ncbi:3-hydroxyacyl-ACP dehydratase FabZ [Candidatus Phycosocius spiralis]|uniref:3-hydroxyacyl-[acyl-carrier-protein] dehydratase FabZ n=1 Tax=Candidatus Phycosocius spiralis TaxID=2815099 RepID=A0ABQ4PSY9_9PROT|nr:3-hydroxyacyl-ACP dehydratase FabZ [Candidatus Phycosocius spiralis]GIU66116.1 3-hydroxyacyl-[acyl-carrier-protein] dehydratase FabZ [Candidatus Phycosocius spiralis]
MSDLIESDEIESLIPHRFPFLLVDRCLEYVEGQSIRGVKCVTSNEPFFQGHFPGRPLMPGVLQIEAMAQASAVLMSKTLKIDAKTAGIMFMSVEAAKFRRPVRPGDVLDMKVEVVMGRRNVYKFAGIATVEGQMACEAQWAAMKVDLG